MTDVSKSKYGSLSRNCQESRQNIPNNQGSLSGSDKEAEGTTKQNPQANKEESNTPKVPEVETVPEGMDKELFYTFLKIEYRIEKKLGKGSMGTVYLVWNQKENRQEAMKVLSKQDIDSSLFELFKREKQSLKDIKTANPNLRIPVVYSTGETKEWLYYTMEYLPGQSLEDYIKEKKLSLEAIIKIILDIAESLKITHRKKIVHRDIKPANIMMVQGVAWLIDFGVAKCLKLATLSPQNAQVGTPYYMSPEQIIGKNDIDGRSDLYSLGAVFYEILTGQTLAKGGTWEEILQSIKEVPAPSQFNKKVDKELERICLKALENDKEKRYKTASKWISDLKKYLNRKGGGDGHPKVPWLLIMIVIVFAFVLAVLSVYYLTPVISDWIKNNKDRVLLVYMLPPEQQAFYSKEPKYETLLSRSLSVFSNFLQKEIKIQMYPTPIKEDIALFWEKQKGVSLLLVFRCEILQENELLEGGKSYDFSLSLQAYRAGESHCISVLSSQKKNFSFAHESCWRDWEGLLEKLASNLIASDLITDLKNYKQEKLLLIIIVLPFVFVVLCVVVKVCWRNSLRTCFVK